MENNNQKENVPKYTVVVWFKYTEQVRKEVDGQVGNYFEEFVGFETLGFNTNKEAVDFKNKIWLRGYQTEDAFGRDWMKVIRVRIINNQLAKEEAQKSKRRGDKE